MPGYKRKRGKDSYQLIVTLGTDYAGKSIRYSKTVHCASDAAAERELSKFFAACESGNYEKSTSFTVGNLLDMYLDYTSTHKRKNTYRGYMTIRKRIANYGIDSIKIKNVNRKKVQDFIDAVSKDFTPKTTKNTYSFMHAAFDWAIKKDLVDRTPCEYIDLPAQNKKETASYNETELAQLLKLLDALPENKIYYKVSVLMALLCGLRRGEICGLDQSDIVDGTISITKTRNVEKGGIFVDVPKSTNSYRKVAMPDVLKKELIQLDIYNKKQKLKLSNKYVDSDALIKNPYGEPLHPNSISDWFSDFIEKNNLPKITFHGLRHTHVSMLVNSNIDITRVSKRIGHGDINITLGTYAHLFKSSDDDITSKINSQISQLKLISK